MSSKQCIYLIVYVDDILITGNDQDGIQRLKHLFSHFHTKDLGKLKYFLGIEIAQSKSSVIMNQRKYALEILKDTSMLDCKLVDTPMDPNVKLVLGQGECHTPNFLLMCATPRNPLGQPSQYLTLSQDTRTYEALPNSYFINS